MGLNLMLVDCNNDNKILMSLYIFFLLEDGQNQIKKYLAMLLVRNIYYDLDLLILFILIVDHRHFGNELFQIDQVPLLMDLNIDFQAKVNSSINKQ